MIIGCLKERMDLENRVGLTPRGAEAFVKKGHEVLVEKGAGVNSSFPDDDYLNVGAKIVATPQEVCKNAQLILKVKAPLPSEYNLFNENQIVFTYFHFASNREMTLAMQRSKAVCVAYETVEVNHKLPLLAPMSEFAGKMAVVVGSNYLSKIQGGKGVLVSGIYGVEPAKVVVIGLGVVGTAATVAAAGIGADVVAFDVREERLEELGRQMPAHVRLLKSSPEAIAKAVKNADMVIGAVYLHGAKAPRVVTEEMVKSMEPGSVIVDVAIDQGGCIETSRPTKHSDPVYVKHGVLHYCVTNMPSAYARTSTLALTNQTLPYAFEMAEKGIEIFLENEPLAKGVNMFKGHCTNKGVADAFNLKYEELKPLLKTFAVDLLRKRK